MSRNICCSMGVSLFLFVATSVFASSFGTVINGGLKITGAGTGLMFPDGTSQSTATLQGPIGVTGSQGIQGIQGPKGDKGDPGIQGLPGTSGKWVKNQETILTSTGVISTSNYFYDTAGNETGYIQLWSPTMTVIKNYTAFDSNNNPTAGSSTSVNTGTPSSANISPMTITYIYSTDNKISSRTESLDNNGNIMSTTYYYVYAPDNSYTVTTGSGSITTVMSYDAKNNLLSTVATNNGTVYYSGTRSYTYDANGNPFYATFSGGNSIGFVYISWMRL